MLNRFLQDESGASAVEYGLIIAVLSLVIVTAVGKAANSIEFLFSNSSSRLVQVFGSP